MTTHEAYDALHAENERLTAELVARGDVETMPQWLRELLDAEVRDGQITVRRSA